MNKSILSQFSELKDHRMQRHQLHPMENILFISIAGIICGAESWNDIEDYGNSKKEWLGTILDLKNGIPSHDTFNRFFQLFDPKKF